MNRTFHKKFGRIAVVLILACMLSGFLLGMPVNAYAAEAGQPASANAEISFVDDDGRLITLDAPAERIISLYSAHTENLFSLGVEDKIIGVHDTSIYPAEAAFLPQFDYDADPENIIAADPDLVLIRPFISRRVPALVETLERAGIKVVSLYPESHTLFDDYIMKLALLTGTSETAAQLLAQYHQDLEAIHAKTRDIEDKQTIFFESTETNLHTVTANSMPAYAIEIAGGINVAAGAEPVQAGSSIASFGAEKILELADEIDVYVSQRGSMNAGGNLHSISIRPGFNTIKAVKDGRIFVINEKIISSPTFRFYKGAREIARYLYPQEMDDLSAYLTDQPATKRDLANILLRSAHLQIYTTTSSSYYETGHRGHTYGLFADVDWPDPDFDAIETVVMRGYVDWELEEEKEVYHPETLVTREDLAKAIFMLHDFESAEPSAEITDINDSENARMIQTLVAHGIFTLTEGKFEPQQTVTCREIVELLEIAKDKQETAAAS